MTNEMRRAAAVVAALVCGLVLALSGTAMAGGDHGKDHGKDDGCLASAKGDGTAVTPGGLPFASPMFDLCKTGPGKNDVRGYFRADVTVTGGKINVQGPVTCAVFTGKTVSFLYPLNEKSQPPQPVMAILVVAKDGGDKPADDAVGFAGPLPAATFNNNCGPTSPQDAAARNAMLPLGKGFITVKNEH